MLEPQQTTFIILSFEGPDVYSQAGGLGVRVKELSRALAERGFETHLFFVGDPTLPPHESALDGKLWLHRWSQWISRFHPVGVGIGVSTSSAFPVPVPASTMVGVPCVSEWATSVAISICTGLSS